MLGNQEDSYAYHDVPRDEMVEFVPHAAKTVLDVGCGRGGFGRALKLARPGVRVTGVEQSPDAASVARLRYDDLIEGGYPQDLPPAARFDCIVFNDVLEHFIDPGSALRVAPRWLTGSGSVVGSIPNVRYWPVVWDLVRHGGWEYRDDGVLDRTHLRFFTSGSLEALLQASGLAIEFVLPINELEPRSLPRSQSRLLRVLDWVAPVTAADFRAQQFAFRAYATD